MPTPIEEASMTTSGLMKLMNASKSRRSNARNAAIISSTGSVGAGCSDISLRPFLDKPFGGSTRLIDVVVAGATHDHAAHPCVDLRDPVSNVTLAACRAALLDEDAERDAAAEVENLLYVDLELLVRADPVLQEATDRGHALQANAQRHHLPHGIGSVEARHRVKVGQVPQSLKPFAPSLYQVGGRGLFGHDPPSIPLTTSRW